MSRTVTVGDDPLGLDDVVAVARGRAVVALSEAACRRVAAGHDAVEHLAAQGTPIYGVTTGLGANVDTAVALDPVATQRRVPRARMVGIGPPLSTEAVRAAMLARIAGLAFGVSGASVAAADSLVRLLNGAVHPVVPAIGSIGESDLVPLAHIAAVVFGEGQAEVGGTVMPGAEALRRAGIAPLEPGSKDGLSLIGSNAVLAGMGALLLADAGVVVEALVAASALSFEGHRASIGSLDRAALAVRPMPGQDRVAAAMLDLMAGGDLLEPGAARSLQPPLSFRCVPQVHGALLDALQRARCLVEAELNGAHDNPAFIGGRSMPTANFDSTHVALALHGLSLAMAYAAAAAGERIMKLMAPGSSDLPRFLSPLQQGRSGFAPLQKTVSALVAEIQMRAMPAPVVILPVADRVEDFATMAFSLAERCGAVVERLRWLVAIELLVAAQACDLRGTIRLGSGTGRVKSSVRAVVPRLGDDRAMTPDIEAVTERVITGEFRVPPLLAAAR